MNSGNSQERTSRPILGIVYALVLTIGVTVAIWVISVVLRLHASYHVTERDEVYALIQIIVTTLNILLITVLLSRYMLSYFKFNSAFTLTFILLALAMLSDNIASNPLFFSLFGYSPMQGPFLIVPSVFTLFTTIILFYLHEQ